MNTKALKHFLELNNEKRKQLETAKDITLNLTSDTGCTISMELYDNNIVRYIIEGTRANTTICFNTLTYKKERKPYNRKPWFEKNFINISYNELLN